MNLTQIAPPTKKHIPREVPYKIEIRNVKYLAANSLDSHCFSATVYVDGKRSFIAHDDGWGGEMQFSPLPKKDNYREVNEQVDAVNNELGHETIDCGTNGGNEAFSIFNSLDIVIGDLVNCWLFDREFKKAMKKVLYEKGGKLYQCNVKPTADNIERVKTAKWYSPDCVILNELPETKAKALYRSVG